MSKNKPVLIRVSKSKEPEKKPREIPTSKVLETKWAELRANAVKPETHPDDVENMHRAFYAGAYSVLDTLINTDCLDEKRKGATKSDRDRIGALWWEVCDFLNALANGKTTAAEQDATLQ